MPSETCEGCYYTELRKEGILRCRFCSRNPNKGENPPDYLRDEFTTRDQLIARGIPVREDDE